MNTFYGNWECKEDVARDFAVDIEDLKKVKILFAWYSYEDYSGSAFVLFKKGRKLYEVHGGHCSCNSLEDQWEPTEVTVAELLYRLENGACYYLPDEHKDEMIAFLKGGMKSNRQ
jgi:hypothetical protein